MNYSYKILSKIVILGKILYLNFHQRIDINEILLRTLSSFSNASIDTHTNKKKKREFSALG